MLEVGNLSQLAELSPDVNGVGVVDALFRKFLTETLDDLILRATIKAPRTIDIRLAFVPMAYEQGQHTGDLKSIAMTVEVNGKRPVLRTEAFSVRPSGKRSFTVLPGMDDPDQGKIEFDKKDEMKGGERR